MELDKETAASNNGQSRDVEPGTNLKAPSIPKLGFQDPFDFSATKKWAITISAGLTTFTVTIASSIFSSAVPVTSKEFNVSETVTLLGVSLYVVGFMIGPLVFGPLSEAHGRRTPLLTGYCLFALMQIPIALAPNLPGMLICRFLAGSFGSAPMVLVGAMYADFWHPSERALASAVFSVGIFAGPTLGPIIGSFLVQSSLGWRWTAWIVLILATVIGVSAFFLIPETYAPVLKERANRRKEVSDNLPLGQTLARRFSSISHKTAKNFIRRYLLKPIIMLAREPVLAVITLYMSLAYGIMYLTFYSFPYSFSIERGWRPQIGTLPFLSLFVGVISSCLLVAIYNKYYFAARMRQRGGKLVPEDRLPCILVGGILLPIGLFWFAWTSSPSISWVPQVLSGYCIGSGIMLIMSMGTGYTIDIYLSHTASALAGQTAVRSLFGAGLPLAGPAMYKSLKTAWATSILAFACVVLIPAPLIFYRYGPKLRATSRYAWRPPTQEIDNHSVNE